MSACLSVCLFNWVFHERINSIRLFIEGKGIKVFEGVLLFHLILILRLSLQEHIYIYVISTFLLHLVKKIHIWQYLSLAAIFRRLFNRGLKVYKEANLAVFVFCFVLVLTEHDKINNSASISCLSASHSNTVNKQNADDICLQQSIVSA